MKATSFKQWLVWQLRRLSYRWPPRSEAMRAAKIERGRYRCAKCRKIFSNREISLDHIKPVIDPAKGFVDWDTYISRLFCKASGFQVLCKQCHDTKTKAEKVRRTHGKTKGKN